jgi:hypothetical protein
MRPTTIGESTLKTKAFVYYHQGMTDLVVCMGLIDHYSSLYDEVLVFLRSDVRDMMDFYLRGKDNVEPIYFKGDDGRYYGTIEKSLSIDRFHYSSANNGSLLLNPEYVMCTHGEHDKWREDKLGMRWYNCFVANRLLPGTFKVPHFTEAFYEYYNLSFWKRITDFNIERDTELEDAAYEKFIKEHGEDYVLYHDDQKREETKGVGVPYKSTHIELDRKEGVSYVNLNKVTNTFFDYIKIIENAQEIHVVDSVWACLIYQLDCRYGTLNNTMDQKTVNVYCQRGHYEIFKNPVTLPNWNLI